MNIKIIFHFFAIAIVVGQYRLARADEVPASQTAPVAPVVAPKTPDVPPDLVNQNFLIIAGEGQRAQDRDVIVVRVKDELLYSFKYCAPKEKVDSTPLDDVREAFSLHTISENNNALAAKLFASPLCEVLTSNPVYVMHLRSEDPLSTQISTGLAKTLENRSDWNTTKWWTGAGTVIGATWSYIRFVGSRAENNTLSLFSFMLSGHNKGRLQMAASIVLAAAASTSLYFSHNDAEEYRSMNLLSNFVNLNGRLLEVDGSISSFRHVLETGLIEATQHGEISIM